jgi:NlpC/P60 family
LAPGGCPARCGRERVPDRPQTIDRVDRPRRQVEALAARLADQAGRQQRLQARLAARRRCHQRLTRRLRRAVAEERRPPGPAAPAGRRAAAAGPGPGGLPRVSRQQWNAGPTSARQPGPGDLVFFANNGGNPSTVHHVGMYVGGGAMIEAPYSGASVPIASIGRGDYIGAVRPTG